MEGQADISVPGFRFPRVRGHAAAWDKTLDCGLPALSPHQGKRVPLVDGSPAAVGVPETGPGVS